MSKFKVGDKVRAIDTGRQYSTYKDFIPAVLPEKFSLWEKGRRIKEGDTYKVLAAHIHTTIPSNGMLYIVENPEKTEVYIIGEKGLELVEPALPRICYILGGEDTPLEIGEEFSLNAYDPEYKKDIYVKTAWIDKNGTLQGFHNKDLFSDVINHPEKIIRRKPKIEFSDDEKAFMRLLTKEGYKWIARDKDDTLAVFAKKPKTVGCDDGTFAPNYDVNVANLPDNILTKITFENSPINMEDYI